MNLEYFAIDSQVCDATFSQPVRNCMHNLNNYVFCTFVFHAIACMFNVFKVNNH